MIVSRELKIDEAGKVRCYWMIKRKSDQKFGETCNRVLGEVNSKGQIAGKFLCRCKAEYEIIDGKQNLIRHKQVVRHNKQRSKEAIK